MTANASSPSQSVHETAAYWAMRLSSEDCGPADRAAFLAWRDENPDHAAAFERTERALRTVDRHMADPELEDLSRQVLAETAPRQAAPVRWLVAGIAASLCILAGLSALLLSGPGQVPQTETMTAALKTYETAVGERSTITLSDGSVVTLNTDSRIEVDFEEAVRNIALVRGQALFEVANDASRPFIVKAGNQRITALGTLFDVRFDREDEIRVVLVEGRVAVDELDTTRLKVGEPDRIEMTPGETLLVKASAGREVLKADVEVATSWRDGRLVFRREPLQQAVAEINRYSTSKIRLEQDPRLEALTVSGVFKVGKPDSFVLALETMHTVEASRTSDDEITLRWGG